MVDWVEGMVVQDTAENVGPAAGPAGFGVAAPAPRALGDAPSGFVDAALWSPYRQCCETRGAPIP